MTCTLVGPDIAGYQAGLDLSRLTTAPFVIAKVTEGASYVDPPYDAWRRQAAHLGKLFVWYHFLTADPAAKQASNTLAHVGDAALPGMLDVEPSGSFSPTLAQALAYIDAARAVGLRVRLAYLPHWYWQELGSPDLSVFTRRGVSLVSSEYPGKMGTPEQLYTAAGGDAGSGWAPYGNVAPLLWQFTDQASDGGQLLDENAFRGTVAELAALLGVKVPAPSPAHAPSGSSAPSAAPAQGSTAVRILQQELDAYGGYGLAADGVKGPKTDAALRAALSGVIASGASGRQVRVLQAALDAEGYAVAVDGSFGPATRTAVEAFQRARGLSVDGVVGARTVAALAG